MESHVPQHSSRVASCFVFFCCAGVFFSSWIWREDGTGEDAREELLQLLRVIKAIKSFLILIRFKDRTKAFHLEDIALLSRNLLQKRKMLEIVDITINGTNYKTFMLLDRTGGALISTFWVSEVRMDSENVLCKVECHRFKAMVEFLKKCHENGWKVGAIDENSRFYK